VADFITQLQLLPVRQNDRVRRYYVDLLVGDRLIVECYGDYWHCNPILYQAHDDHTSLHMTAGEKWKKDAVRRSRLEEEGYEVVVLWEADIKNNFEAVSDYLTEILTRHVGGEKQHAA
jgi:very-short-patch-repair endonuclease